MRRLPTARVLVLFAAFTFFQFSPAHAAVLTWNLPGGGTWDTTSANWSGTSTTFTDGGVDDVIFNNTGGGTVNILANMTPASTTVSATSGTYTFTGGPIDGSGGLTKSGNGMLLIDSANSYTGATSIQYGTLRISDAGALGSGGGTTVVVGSNGNTGSTLSLTGGITVYGSLQLQSTSSGRSNLKNSGGDNEWAGNIDLTNTGNHPMFQVDSGTLNVSGDITGTVTGGNFYIRGNNTNRITGNVNITGDLHKRDNGTWIIGNSSTPKTYSWTTTTVDRGVLGFAAANLHPAVLLTLGSDQSGSAIFKLGDGTTGYDQTVTGLATTGVTATRKVVGGGSNIATLTVDNSASYTYNGFLGGSGTYENNLAIKKVGAGGLTLGGDNTYLGETRVERGTLTVTHANALGSTAAGTVLSGVSGGGEVSIVITGGITVAEPLFLSGSIQRANLKNGSGNNTWAGNIDITSAGSQQPMFYSSNSGTLTVTGDITGTNVPNFYIRGTNTTDNWISGGVNISGALYKRDTGTWMIGNPTTPKTYSWSQTTVEAGVLKFAAANVHPASAVLTLNTNQGKPATVMLGDGTTGYSQTVAGLRTLSAASHNVVGGGANMATLTINNTSSYNYGDVLGGSGTNENNLALTKNGSGTQTLSGTTANTYTGMTTVNAGTLALAKSAGVDAIGGNVTVAGGTLRWDQDNQLSDSATLTQTDGTVDFSGESETFANYTKSGGGTSTGGASAVITITDTLTISGGSYFNFNSPSTVSANKMVHTGGAITVGAGGALLEVGAGGLEMTGSTITLNLGSPGSTLRLGGDVTVNASASSAHIAIGSSGTNNAAVDLNGATRTFAVANGSANPDMRIDASVRNGGLTKTGAGTLTLSGATPNTYTGLTTVSGGTLSLGKTAGVDAVAGDILINGGTLSLGAANQIADTSSITLNAGVFNTLSQSETVANLTINAAPNVGTYHTLSRLTVTGTLELNAGQSVLNSGTSATANTVIMTGGSLFSPAANGSNNSTFSIGSGGLTMSGATLQMGYTGGTATCLVNLGGNFTGSGTNAITTPNNNGPRLLNLGGLTRTFDITDGTTTIAATIENGGLTKTGAGTLLLTGINTYTAATILNAGTLGGNGSLASALTVNSGTLAPGTSPGILTLDNGVTFTGGTFAVELEGTTVGTEYDQLLVTGGDVTLGDGVAALEISGSYGAGPNDFFWIINNTSTTNGDTTGYFQGLADEGSSLQAAGRTFYIYYQANFETGLLTGGNDVLLTSVPEPSALAMLLGLGALGLVGYLRRRRRN